MIRKEEITMKNILAYLQGTFRYHVYYSKWKRLIRGHIRQQIVFRISVMDKECYDNGSCKLCGCSTTALQMANKSCNKPCYPPMMDVSTWEKFKTGATIQLNNHSWKGIDGNMYYQLYYDNKVIYKSETNYELGK